MPSTFSPNLNLELQATGEDTNVWGQNLNNNVFSKIDAVLGNTLSLPLVSTDVTLTTTQTQNNFIDLSGVIIANINIIFPAIGRTFYVRNGTTGNFTVTLKTVSAGASFVIPQGTSAFVVLDGPDVLPTPAGIWEPIGSYPLSGATALNVPNLSAFEFIRIYGYLEPSVTGGILIRTSIDNGVTYDAGASDYGFQTLNAASTTIAASSTPASAMIITGSTDAGANFGVNFTFELFNFNKARYCRYKCNALYVNSTRFAESVNGGSRAQATARNALQLIAQSGTLTGRVIIEGVR